MLSSNITRLYQMLSNKRITTFKQDYVDSSVTPVSAAYCVSRFNNVINEKLIQEINDNSSLPVYIKKGRSVDDKGEPVEGEVNDKETSHRIPIIMDVPITSIPFTSFNFDRYYSNLESFRFGHTVVYSEITTSTIDLIRHLTSIDGLIVVAGQQTQGRGRSGNHWISPKGCAMFSLSLHISLSSRLGQSLGLVQHLISLSIHRGITRTPGYENLDLHLKWPNDIYWGRTIKVGGIMVTSSLIGTEVRCVASAGINVNNSDPAQPLNQLIANSSNNKDLQPLTAEEIIARSLNELDYLIRETERTGVEMVKKLYLQSWLHFNQKINMADGKEVTIKGIDDHGYMLVEDSEGETLTVQPDGNRFDMMHNLIVKK